VSFLNDDGQKKIILKEKGSKLDDSEYIIRKFKVTVARNSKKKDDHILLVSFSQKSIQNPNKITHIIEHPRNEIEHGYRAPNNHLTPQRTKSKDQILTGPGSELIKKIIDGNDSLDSSRVEEEDHGVYEPAYHIQTSPSKSSSRNSHKINEKRKTSSKIFFQKVSSSSEDEYIDDLIKKIKKANGQESSVISASQSQYSTHASTTQSQSRHTPYSQKDANNEDKMSRLSPVSLGNINTPVSVSYIGASRFSNVEITKNQSNSILHYTLNNGRVEYVGEEVNSVANISRSSTRNASVIHEGNHDTQSIGPGSMAGGSLFGGYIPTHAETSSYNVEKSAFSEYNYSKVF
jgi:hypothetical protein